MISIFTIPKAFKGHIGLIQRNAILSWKELHPDVEILIFGQEEGVVEFCEEEGLSPPINCKVNEHGTPYLDEVFQKANDLARHTQILYANADIIFRSDLLDAFKSLPFENYLLIGPRFNIDLDEEIDFKNDWFEPLRKKCVPYFSHPGKYGSDYFGFRKNSGLEQLPPFVVGRPFWDNWMIKNAREKRVSVVNGEHAIYDIHQNHDYSHVPEKKGKVHAGPEMEDNKKLHGEFKFSLADATHEFSDGIVVKCQSKLSWRRFFITLPHLNNQALWSRIVSRLGLASGLFD